MKPWANSQFPQPTESVDHPPSPTFLNWQVVVLPGSLTLAGRALCIAMHSPTGANNLPKLKTNIINKINCANIHCSGSLIFT